MPVVDSVMSADPSNSTPEMERGVVSVSVLLARPDGMAEGAEAAFADYVYLRDNPAGVHRELWFHEQGDRSWLVVTRDTLTHEILGAELARDVALAMKGSTL